MTPNDDFLPGVLLQQVRHAQRTSKRETLLDYAIHAATEPDRDQRVWALVALAKQLRGDDQRDRALAVLDAAAALDPSWQPEAAVFTTAAAIHCDLGNLDKARAICDQTMERGVDEYILKTAARVYWELARSTKLEEFYDRWKALSTALEELSKSVQT